MGQAMLTDRQRQRELNAHYLYSKTVDVCCAMFKCDVNMVLSSCRLGSVVNCRMHCAYLMRRLGGSYPSIGRYLGRDHSSIMHAVGKINHLAWASPERRKLLEKMEREIRGNGFVGHDEEWWNRC